MVSVYNPHRDVLWGFLFACPSIFSAWCTVHLVLAHSIPLGIDDSPLNRICEGRS